MNEIDRIFDEHRRRMDRLADEFAASVRADMEKALNRMTAVVVAVSTVIGGLLCLVAAKG